MPSHFSAIGFPVKTREEFGDLALRAAEEGREIQMKQGFYACWSPGAGVQLWAQADPNRQLIGCNPHFSGPGRVPVAVTAALPSDDYPLDGSFHAWAAPGEKPEDGTYPFVFDAPDFRLAAEEDVYPRRAMVQVAAFAEELTCYPDETAFTQAKTGDRPGFAPESFIPSGLFVGEGERPRAAAVFTGRILHAERRANPVTGMEFYWLSVRSYGGVYDVVADPAFFQQPPVAGGIVQGSFWLSGRLLTETSA